MATRRPNVPRAQFSAGAKNGEGPHVPGSRAADSAVPADTDAAQGAKAQAPSTTAPHGPVPGSGPARGMPVRGTSNAHAPGRRAPRQPAPSGRPSETDNVPTSEQQGHAPAAGAFGDGKRGRGFRPPSEGVIRRDTGATGAGKRTATAQPAAGKHPAEEHQVPVPARAFSGRLLALAVVLITITVLLAPNVRTYVAQRAEIIAVQQDISAKSVQNSELTSELARWEDPNYVRQQARDRVSMMMPGETGYWVYGAGVSDAAAPDPADPATPTSDGTQTTTASSGAKTLPWVDGLWTSIERSASPAAVKPATPSSKSTKTSKPTSSSPASVAP